MTKKVYNTEFKQTIVSLYQSGKTVNELCAEFNISTSSETFALKFKMAFF